MAAMTADGYFRTGDVGVMLPDGQIKIVDRLKDMIIVSGFKVYPNEVENVVAMHPGVLEEGAVGVTACAACTEPDVDVSDIAQDDEGAGSAASALAPVELDTPARCIVDPKIGE